jgi:cytochrome P450
VSYGRHESALNLAAHPLLWTLAGVARRMGAVWRVPGLGVVVSDASCAREILRRDADFTKNGPGSFAGVITRSLGELALGNMDGDEHRRIRDALADVLSPARSEEILLGRQADLETLCRELANGVAVDMAVFARRWAGRLAFDVIGASPPPAREVEAAESLVRLSANLSSILGFRQPSRRELRKVEKDREALSQFFRAAYQCPAPQNSLIATLQSLGLGFESALGLISIYAIGGTLTLSASLPRIIALLADSGAYCDLVKDNSLIAQAIDEGLRFTTPLPGTVRIARRDSIVNGHVLARNTRLVILTCNMARDPQFFSDAGRFDITRTYNPRAGRLWYGAGVHRCVGFSLAQRALKESLRLITADVPSLRVVKRRYTFRSLLPAYRNLIVQSAPADH